MFAWLRKLFRRSATPTCADATEPPPWARLLLHEYQEEHPSDQQPAWADDVLETQKRAAREQVKVGLRVDQVDHKLDEGFGELRRRLGEMAPKWDEVLDAMDLLEEARQSLLLSQPAVAAGLAGVQARLTRHLTQGGLVRHAPLHQPPDAALYRVVGTEERPELPEGVVTRVVRAAVTRGGDLYREGAVLTNVISDMNRSTAA